jgi:hypothetical protein
MKDEQIKERVKERYGKIALTGNSESCCSPTECCGGTEVISPIQIAKSIGYDAKELKSVPESSILGVGCGAPVNLADIKEGEVVVDKGLKGFGGIGGIVGLDIFFLGFISGASMNPARSLAPALLSGTLGNLCLYWSATFIGTSTIAFLLRKKFVNISNGS